MDKPFRKFDLLLQMMVIDIDDRTFKTERKRKMYKETLKKGVQYPARLKRRQNI